MKLSNAFTAMLLAALCLPASAQDSAIDPALLAVVEARDSDHRARDQYRHPAETLSFFQLEPGMTVAEALPGRGWYTRILANYLGGDGAIYGVNYSDRTWPMFGFMSEDTIKERIASTGQFPNRVEDFTDNGIEAEGFTFNTVPSELVGTADHVLFIRALHNLNRFEAQAGTATQALAATRSLLKDGGMVGVVQHRLPEDAADEGADGSRGYLKQSQVISMFETAGFELVASSEINANPKDRPGPEDIVWRLPPSLNGSKDDPEKRAAMEAIGESDRMTLLFRKVD